MLFSGVYLGVLGLIANAENANLIDYMAWLVATDCCTDCVARRLASSTIYIL